MKQQALGRLFYKEIAKIHRNEALERRDKLGALHKLLQGIFIELTKPERIHFTTLFARIAYASHKHNLSRQQQFFIHHFRKRVRKLLVDPNCVNEQLEREYQFGLQVLANSIEALFEVAIPEELLQLIPQKQIHPFSPVDIKAFRQQARLVVLDIDKTKEQLIAKVEAAPGGLVRVQYNIAERNENFNPSIHLLEEVFGFPVTINLIDVEIDSEGLYRPRALVIEPDYLVDVSAIAECFKHFGAEPRLYLLKKFLPFEYTKYLMIGNIANFFLDELMSNPQATFKETFPKVFQLNPLAFATFDNALVREIAQTSQKHFVNLKNIIQQDFRALNIEAEHCFLEPTFYSNQYGMQGRLDVFYNKLEEEQVSAIIELKSGKAYRPNQYGISQNHYTQTLLYDLLIKSAFGTGTDPTNYILYSGVDQRHLRFAPVVKAQQFEALQVRNQLVGLEWELAGTQKELNNSILINRLNPINFPRADGFVKRDLQLFTTVWQSIPPLERKYFTAYASFIAREHQLAKTGMQGMEKLNGQAALWLNNVVEKQEGFELISHLKIIEQQAGAEEPLLSFAKTDLTNPLANFRKGDIAVLYPIIKENDTPLSNQLFKCTIIDIGKKMLTVRLRSKQFNSSIFEQKCYWNIEHDLLDSGFNSMYRSLFQFAQSGKRRKDLLLTTVGPKKVATKVIPTIPELTDEQQGILQQLISAEDYFLLWGPPGTGKTSKMLKHLVAYLLNHTEENILLLAYTNRAVDEICESIESIDSSIREQYLRIGSRYSTPAQFQDQLLNKKIEKVDNRKALREIIQSHRIIVGTISSIASKPQLMQLKTFHRAIIDEASQILEPILAGLLPHFQRFVLIGDHKQLPAVVVQDETSSAVLDKDLQDIGLHNMRNSLFERLYNRCQENNWDWAYACLSHQGRMHQDIMRFPNEHFYDGTLQILPKAIPYSKLQLDQLDLCRPEQASALEDRLIEERMLFIPTPIDQAGFTQKTNRHEARLIGQLVQSFRRIYASNGLELNKNTIGIITPFRAQIAAIRHELHQLDIDPEELTVDTVERYQGGSRDIVLISLCSNAVSQLASISSLSHEGVDRKLNVALTRARKHLVLLGNPEVLRANPVYANLIRFVAPELRSGEGVQ